MRTLIACAIVLIVVHRCLAGSIGLYSDTAGSNCTLTIDQGQTGVAYALGRTSAADPDDGYITNCEFRIIGLPSGWLATALPDAAISIAVGDPLGDGTNLYWDVPPHGLIPLFTIYITAMTQESNVELQVVKHVDPSPPFGSPITCPWFRYACPPPCDASGVCVEGLSMVVNGPCTMGIEPTTWSRLRSLYR